MVKVMCSCFIPKLREYLPVTMVFRRPPSFLGNDKSKQDLARHYEHFQVKFSGFKDLRKIFNGNMIAGGYNGFLIILLLILILLLPLILSLLLLLLLLLRLQLHLLPLLLLQLLQVLLLLFNYNYYRDNYYSCYYCY